MEARTVYVVDDDGDVLKAIARLLESAAIQVIAFQSPSAFLAHRGEQSPACLVLDLAMPELSGVEVQHALARRGALLPVVFLTGRGDIRTCAEAMKDGAVDFLTKPVDEADLLAAVERGLSQARAMHEQRSAQERNASALSALTDREREVLRHIVAGRLNKQIAAQLGTVEKTIKFHRGNLMRKLGVRSVAELVRLASRTAVGDR